MTQSGQGNVPQPPAQPPREGVALPAHQAPAPGQSWGGGPWGPDAHRAPLPPEAPPRPGDSEATQYIAPALGAPGAHAASAAQDPASQATQYMPPVGAGPLPGAPPPPAPYARGASDEVSPQPASDAQGPAGAATQYIPPVPGQGTAGAATQYLPPVRGGGDSPAQASAGEATQYLPSVQGGGDSASQGAAGAATQYLPPVRGGGDSAGAATQYLSPVRPAQGAGGAEGPQYLPAPGAGSGGGDAGAATQYLPPVADGPVPEAATQYMPPVREGAAGAATQYLPPVGGTGGVGGPPGAPAAYGNSSVPRPPREEERPPPAEFDQLFRTSGGTPLAGPAHQAPPVRGPARTGAPVPPPSPTPRTDPAGKRRLPTAAIVGIVVAGCAVAGLAAGALLSGGDDKKSDPQNAAVSSAEPTAPDKGEDKDDGTKKTPAPADPAAAQAKALDALLKDSNNSRDAVIKAVDSTKSCKDLGPSASNLRDAAKQRDGLVTRLQQTTIDKLPGSGELSAQLTKAWQSSSSADSHYAKWADQVGGKNGCVKGHARPSGESAAGDRASGDATAAKKKAADLWDPIAKKYGLTPHKWTQL
ncbi:hypothetical protein [Streptomyces sp. ISL-11]|uniref:hypothetical protein n=1 Tax=Streptomyces sp. ISL-11 TaxID=2819174 RepID=UPI001BECA93D|nr:hypothetical protein [Streptomyces sp. ISL-11]MBT2383187.1 hypothetical protein [Streptomyces sp. ISL-11]